MTSAGWGDGQVAMLKQLFEEGLSCSVIAARLGNGCTRNAVIGKIHRLNFQPRHKPPPPLRDPNHPFKKTAEENLRRREQRAAKAAGPTLAPVSAPKAQLPPAPASARPAPPVPRLAAIPPPRPVAALPAPLPARLPDLPDDGRVTILHLSDKTCRWPIGNPGHEDFCFCGHTPRDGSPYCEFHARLAYQPLTARQRSATVNRRWGG